MAKYPIRSFFFVLACCIFCCLSAAEASAATRAPLLQEGKKTLYQRVVTHPGALLHTGPDAATKGDPIKSFSVYYVYEKKNGFLEVGPSSNASIGWASESDVTFWPQAMTLLFSDRGQRSPVLFFKDRATLEAICNADDMVARLEALKKKVEEARQGKVWDDSLPVFASEPTDSEGAVARQRFYLLPIQAMANPFESVKFLKVASIDPGTQKTSGKGDESNADKKQAEQPKTGIAFVIDTTISMRPYIEQTRNILKQSFDRIEQTGLGKTAGFAVVAYRNSTEARPGVEYRTKIVSDFKMLPERDSIETAIAKVAEANASTHSFNEDSVAGIKAAVDSLDWTPYDSRVIVLITDAGPLPYGDGFAQTKMGPQEIRDYALAAKNVNTITIHIKTPSGAGNHHYAELAYRNLSRSSAGEHLYLPIEAATSEQGAASFFAVTKRLTEELVSLVQTTATRAPEKPKKEDESPEDEAARIAQALGYALRLDFLGKKRENAAPSVVSAWITDMDLARLAEGIFTHTVDVAVLLTKNQLSDLQQILKIIVDNAERTKRTDSRDFFQSIISASALVSSDPQRLSSTPGINLQQTGVLGEFLEGLPYKSEIMLLDEDQWYRMSVGQQTNFIYRLQAKIERYEEYDKDDANWESFGSQFAGDKVYRIPLAMLP